MTFASKIKAGFRGAVEKAKANYKAQQAKAAHEKAIYQEAYNKAREEGIKKKARMAAKASLGLGPRPAARVNKVKSITPKQTSQEANKRYNPFGRF